MIGDFHIHSKYSFDSNMDPQRILRIAKKKNMDTIAVTDHNTIKGSIEAKKLEKSIGIQVIIGAEIKTDIGDIIGLNLNDEIPYSTWEEVIDCIRDMDGVSILPHPYKQHENILEISKRVDLIEIWNARCNIEQNMRAMNLVATLKKGAIIGSDAHLYSEIGNAISEVDDKSLTMKQIINQNASQNWKIYISQFIGQSRKENTLYAIRSGLRYIWKKII